ncbi:MAG: SGNH/GDSL hydrolase family protein, partial [Elusimicrobia bacterium]|nr:SGNH/GDSL hydrolase family protein [Elusimicrobiota bacterium]
AYLTAYNPQNLMTPAYEDGEGMRLYTPDTVIKNRNRYFDAVYTTNALGLRGPLYPTAKPKGVYRIVALGPSFTFGIGVDDAQTYCRLIEKKLQAAWRRPVQVINMGQPGISMNNYEPLYRRLIKDYDPDLLLVYPPLWTLNEADVVKRGSFYGTDRTEIGSAVRLRRWLRKLRRVPGYAFLCEHSNLLALLRLRVATNIDADALARTPASRPENGERLERTWTRTFESFVDAVSCAKGAAGTRILMLRNTAEGRDFHIIDRYLSRRSARGRCFKVLRLAMRPEYTYVGEGHWNPRGHEFVADSVVAFLGAQKAAAALASAR